MYARDALDGGDAVTFPQEAENHLSLLNGQVHAVQRVVAGIREHLAALRTLVALAVLAFTELPAICTAIVEGDCSISLDSQPDNRIARFMRLRCGFRPQPLVSCFTTQLGVTY